MLTRRNNEDFFSQVLGTEFREQQIDGELLHDATPGDFDPKVCAWRREMVEYGIGLIIFGNFKQNCLWCCYRTMPKPKLCIGSSVACFMTVDTGSFFIR